MPNTLANNRLAAFKRQKGLCYYCHMPMWLVKQSQFASKHGLTKGEVRRLQCTAEHLVARQDGGKNSRNNIVAACRFCNSTRHLIKVPPKPAEYQRHVLNRLLKGKWHPPSIRRLAAPTG